MKSNSYGFLDSSILDVLSREGVVGSYEEALLGLNLVDVRTSQTASVLNYFLGKAKSLGYLTDRSSLGFNPKEGRYYYGTASQLELHGSEVVPYTELDEINRSDYQSWKSARDYDRSRLVNRVRVLGVLCSVLGVSTLALSATTVMSNKDVRKASQSIVTSSSSNSSSSTVKSKTDTVDSDKIEEFRSRISALSPTTVGGSEELESIESDIESIGDSSLYRDLSLKLADISLYGELVRQLDAYPTDAESYEAIERGINSFSDLSSSWKDELFEKLRTTKEYVNSLGYGL